MKRRHRLVRGSVVAALTVTTATVAGLSGSVASAAGCSSYVLPGLPGGPGGGEIIAISAAGIYAGDAPGADGHGHAVYWTHTGNDLSTGWTIHQVPSPITDDFIGDINSKGQMVGTGTDPATGNGVGYIFNSAAQPQTVTMLPGLGGGFDYDRRLNDSGVVVGTSVDTRGVFRSVTWAPPYTKAAILPDAGASRSYGSPYQHYTTGQQAMGINNAGQVVGFSFNGGHYTDTQDFARNHMWHAYVAPLLEPVVWQANGGPHRLPTGNLQGDAWAINDHGVVVGSVITDPSTYTARPEAWVNGTNVDMGAPSDIPFGRAYGLSQGSWAAGGYIESDNTTSRAFTWNPTTGFRTLDPPAPYTNSWAHGVSDALGNVGGSADDGTTTVPVVWHC